MNFTNDDMILLIATLAFSMLFIRVFPVTLFAGKKMPEYFEKWLSFIPSSVLSALTISEIFVRNNSLDFSLSNIFFLASIPTCIIAWYTKSLFITLTLGILIVAVLRYFINV